MKQHRVRKATNRERLDAIVDAIREIMQRLYKLEQIVPDPTDHQLLELLVEAIVRMEARLIKLEHIVTPESFPDSLPKVNTSGTREGGQK